MAVATGMDGFDTLGGMVPAFGFHAVSSMIGVGMIGAAKRAAQDLEPAAA